MLKGILNEVHKHQAKRQEILTKIAGLRREKKLPLDRIKPGHVNAFCSTLKNKLQDKASGLGKKYLKLLVDEVRIGGNGVSVRGSHGALAAAKTVAQLNPNMVFIYVSGMGTDGTEQGRVMGARVKGKTENALLHLPFKAVYMFRPAFIQPLHGIKSRTKIYRRLYALSAPLMPLLNALFRP